jgi:hypothetical protein
VSPVDVVADVHPCAGLLVFGQSRIQLPRDSGAAEVHQFPTIYAESGDGGQTLVGAHEDRKMRVRQQDSVDAVQRGQGNARPQEFTVEAVAVRMIACHQGRGSGSSRVIR